MDWIKKNYEKFSLLLLSLALLGVSVFLFLNAQSFLATFEPLKQPVNQGSRLPPLETKSIQEAQAALDKPATWPNHTSSLFVSTPYVMGDNNIPVESAMNGLVGDDGTPVPNEWLLKYHLDNLNAQTLRDDPDGDGFTNLDEFEGGTDPTDKNSHPPYITKLRLAEFIQVKFRLVYKARPDDNSYQIDTLDVHQPTQILNMGDTIPGTKFKLVKHEVKSHTDANGIDHDDSELTLENIETGEKVVLVIGKEGNSPDSYAKFKYLWHDAANPETPDFTVKKNQDFSIKPEADITYKLIDINENAATIQNLKSKEEIKIPRLK